MYSAEILVVTAVAERIPPAGGALTQFPLRVAIVGMIAGNGMSNWLANPTALLST